jgi:hypothetical protein
VTGDPERITSHKSPVCGIPCVVSSAGLSLLLLPKLEMASTNMLLGGRGGVGLGGGVSEVGWRGRRSGWGEGLGCGSSATRV